MNDVNIIITHKCNLYCKHCYMNAGNNDYENSDKIFQKFKITIDKLQDLGIKKIMITGGECTVSSNLIKMLEYCKRKGMITSIFTNGMILNKKIYNYVDDYNLSIDGLEDYHNDIRGNSHAYKNVLRTINYLQSNNKNITVQMTVTRQNINQVLPTLDVLRTYDIKKVSLCCLLDDGRSIENNLDSNINIVELREIIKRVYRKTGYNLIIHTNIFDNFSTNTFLKTKSIYFPLWIDLINNSFYLVKDNSAFSLKLEELSEKNIDRLNKKINDCISNNLNDLLKKGNYVLENEIIKLLSRGDD